MRSLVGSNVQQAMKRKSSAKDKYQHGNAKTWLKKALIKAYLTHQSVVFMKNETVEINISESPEICQSTIRRLCNSMPDDYVCYIIDQLFKKFVRSPSSNNIVVKLTPVLTTIGSTSTNIARSQSNTRQLKFLMSVYNVKLSTQCVLQCKPQEVTNNNNNVSNNNNSKFPYPTTNKYDAFSIKSGEKHKELSNIFVDTPA